MTSDHLVPQGRRARGLRWVVVVFAAYNVVVHTSGGRWWSALAWAAVGGVLLAVQLAPPRRGTRVEDGGVRVGDGLRWGEPVGWDAVERLAVAGPYEEWGHLVRRDGSRLPLRGMSAQAVRELARARDLPLDDPTRRARASAPPPPQAGPPAARPGAPREALPDGPLDGPFRSSPRSGSAS